MSFVNLVFLCIFLPASVLIVYFLPGKCKNAALVVLSLLFYAWGGPRDALILVLMIVFHYFAGLELMALAANGDKKRARISLIVDACADIFILAMFKYTRLNLPLGISFYTFSSLSYLFDVYGDKAEAERNPIDLALYIAFFPKLTMGPIAQYHAMREQIKSRQVTVKGVNSGVIVFLYGLMKKVLIADNLGAAFQRVYSLPKMAGMTAILGILFYGFQLYFDFSGYSDMAIGIGRMFGFHIDKNFDYPYTSKSASEFWRRWHISLGAWFRDYVYIPMGGSRVGNARLVLNLAVVWVLTGVWHGNTWNFLFWGLYWGAIVILDKFVFGPGMKRLPDPVRVIIVDVLAFVGWVFFFNPTLGSSFGYLAKIFGADGVGFWNGQTGFLLRENVLLLIFAGFASTPVVKTLWNAFLKKMPRPRRRLVFVVFEVFMLLLAFARIVSSTYQTFLYTKF